MFEAYLTAYPWDLADADLDAALDYLQGEVGVAGLSVWAACGPLVVVRARGGDHRVVSTDGGLFFQPEPQHAAGLDGKSLMANWLGDRRPLLRISEACAQRGLKLRMRFPTTAIGGVARRHPELACRNVFGSTSQRSLCLLHPAVRSLSTALTEALCKSHELAGLIWSDVYTAWTEAFAPELHDGYERGDRQRAMLAVCFCNSCMNGATREGVDAAAARENLRAEFDHPPDPAHAGQGPSLQAFRAEGELGRYLRWQSAQLGVLMGGVRAGCRCALYVEQSPGDPAVGDWPAPRAVDDVPLIRLVESNEQLHDALAADSSCQGVRFGPAMTARWSGDSLISAVQEAVGRGITTVEFDGYGFLSDGGLAVIRRAIRYARRTSNP